MPQLRQVFRDLPGAIRSPLLGGAILIILLGLSPDCVRSQEIDSLVRLAMRENPRIRSSAAALEAAGERIGPAGALPDPILSYRLDRIPVDSADPTRAESQRFGVTQMFPFPGKRGSMRAMAVEEVGMARAAQDRVRLEVAADLHKRYAALAAVVRGIEIMDEDVRSLESLAESARTRYEVGRSSQPDLLRTQVELAESRTRATALRDLVPAHLARINALLDRSPDAPIAIVQPDTSFLAAPTDAVDERAIEDQPMVRMSRRAEARSAEALRLARKDGWPDLGLGFEYMAERGMPDSWMGMIEVNLPIWRWNKVDPARRAAEWDLISAREETKRAENDASAMAREAVSELASARREMSLYRTQVIPQAEAALESTRSAYETGRASFMELLDARRTLLKARLDHEEAVEMFLGSRAELWLAVGDPMLLGDLE